MEISSSTKQLLVATAKNYDAIEGTLELFEWHKQWEKFSDPIEIVFGKNGVIAAKDKREGDGKSPLGQFKLGKVYGHAPSLMTKMDYEQISPDLEAVDDPNSCYYNNIVKKSTISNPDWKSSEKMQQIDVYDVAVFVEHNWPKVQKFGGSAIFLHRWSSKMSGTGGCTAMDSADLAKIVGWLDPSREPFLIQKVSA